MNTGIIVAGAAVAALAAYSASATTQKSHRPHRMSSNEGAYAAPAQPIPYAQLDTYIHASSSQRASLGGSPAGMSQAGDISSPAASPNPGAGDQMSAAAAGSPMSPSTEDAGKMGQTQPSNPSTPTNAAGMPPK